MLRLAKHICPVQYTDTHTPLLQSLLTYDLISECNSRGDVRRPCNDAVDEGQDTGHILLSLRPLQFLDQQAEPVSLPLCALQVCRCERAHQL